MTEETVHWADVIAEEALARGKKHTVASGITPSGAIHIGNMREVVTADAVFKALRDKGADARLIYIADTYDPLRKVYPFLSNDYENHIGKPLSEIPCPCGGHKSYSEHFLLPFIEALHTLGIRPQVYRADELYKEGKYVEAIKKALLNRDAIASILEEVSGRELEPDWSPFNPICNECGRLNSTKVTGFDIEKETIDYVCKCSSNGTVSMNGGGKLNWRVDWPARWPIFGTTVEPFGKDHATAGGSYDTGKRIVREIYHYEPPHPIVYEWIMLKGKGAMHSSTGLAISINDMLEIVPPEVLRYLIIRQKPEKHIEFDPGLSLLNLIDEYDRIEGDKRAYQLSQTQGLKPSGIPYRHMVTAVQIADDRGFDYLLTVLKRTNYDTSDSDAIRQRANNARNWLTKYAPLFVKFKVQETIPPQVKSFTKVQKLALSIIADELEAGMTGQDIHENLYKVAEKTGLDGKQVFETVYLALLGLKSGPRAGHFLSSLEKDFLVKRF
ncbi:MAG: lysine--tRNA ligase, partial [Candidatus Methanoperedens sp.]|nr:lysine--tRNA ligase [Candidatus Methanoperedens sp.]